MIRITTWLSEVTVNKFTALSVGIFLLAPCTLRAAPLEVPLSLWNTLTTLEKSRVLATHEINLIDSSDIGLVVDAQSMDSSTPGNDGGSRLGAALGSAIYVDKALGGTNPDYSAKSHLGVTLLGVILGSTLNKQPESRFVTRYTIKKHSNEIVYVDEVTSTPFKHSVGICVQLSPIRLASQEMCSLNKESLLAMTSAPENHRESTTIASSTPVVELQVKCKVGTNGPTMLTASLCSQISGTVIP